MSALRCVAMTAEDVAIFENLRRANFKLRHFYYHTELKAFAQMREMVVIKTQLGGSYALYMIAKYRRWHKRLVK